MKKRYGKAGNWAVVTGASEGIGLAMTMDLARRGFNVCVIARTASKLDAVVEDVKKAGVEGLAIPFDFSTATSADYDKLFKELDKIDVAVLVNNVGVNYDYTNYFDEVDISMDLFLLKVNTEAMVRMTKYVVPKMKAKRAGAIVVLSSVSAVTPTPMLATYAGTKAFNLSFGAGLHYELKEFGIDVLNVTPNLVVSKMTQGKSSRAPKESFLMVNADRMAHQTLDKLGAVTQTSGHSNHAVIETLLLWVPESMRTNKILRFSKAIKARAERNKAPKPQ
ncbi:beta-keto reductase [Strigomonas culicis]|nr:beta-keto reductase [Strigomonas culicis]|eukprot:EPY32682.1 beta-keto reductase [Strigomonas culicis]